ncbi:MAG TPA: SprB repeat-containing protein, partial [Bacteroidales bacterium]|nr:SprB repeat-containing protein [Bacteroidales bacterium]
FVGMKNTSLSAGNHYVVAKDGLGCFDTAFFTITEPAEKLELIVDSLLPVRCKGMSIGEAYLSSKHGAAPISYEWSDGYLELSRVNLPAQTYEVTATDDMGCTDVISFAITEPLDGMEGEVSTFTPPLCFGDKNGKATLSVVGGTPPYTVLWDDAFDNDSTSTDFVRSDLEKRLYSITFFDAEACEYSLSFNMPEPEILTAQILAPDNSPAKISVLCSEDCNINVKVFPEGGTAPYSYAWNNGLPNSQAVQLCANTYEVVVTDANGCSTNASHTVTAPPLLENILEIRSPIQCFGETGEIHSVSVGGTTPYSYAWSNGSTAIKTGKVIAGTYKLTLTDANGCKKVESLLLPQPDTLQLHITIDNLVCQNVADGSLTVAETGGTAPFSYLWSTAESTATIHDLSAQLYHVTVTDNNACVAHDTIDLTNINQFGVIFSSLPVTCEGRSDGEITASAFVGTPPFTYEWHDAVTDSARKNLPVGMYSVTITDALGCTVTDSLNLSIIPPMFVAHSGTTETPCNEAYGSAYITIDGGTKPYSYLWSNAATTDSVGNLPVGSYTVDVTDANACVFSHNFFVDDTSTFAIEVISPDTRIRCENANTGIAIAQPQRGTPPYTFLWSTLETSDTLKNVGAGLYRLTAWDAYFCSAKDSIRFEEFNVLTSTIIDSGMVSCNGNNDGYAVLNVQGGVPPYSILWSNGATDYLNANLSPGTYTCTVTDNAGCVSTN